MATPHPIDPMLMVRLSRFLHTGLEEPKYFPGCWSSHNYYTLTKVTCINAILEADPTCQAVLDLIVKTYRARVVTRYETIAFALVKCLHIGCDKMKQMVYELVPDVCSTPEELLTFANFTYRFKTGAGAGWCRAVASWYQRKDPMVLALEVTRVKGLYGRTHHNLLRRAHVKIDGSDYAREATIKYLVYGLKQAKVLMSDHAEATPVLAHIEAVDKLRHCEDPVAAAAIVRAHSFGLKHIPGHLLTSQDVWEALLPHISLEELLANLLRIHNMGFLTSDSAVTAVILSLLTNADYVRRSSVTPLVVYITIASYNRRYKPLKNAKVKIAAEKKERRRLRQHIDPATQQWVWDNEKVCHAREAKIRGIDMPQNSAVQMALQRTLELSWQPMKQNNSIKYLITMDMRPHMFKGKHFCEQPKPAKKPTAVRRIKEAAASAPPAAAGDAAVAPTAPAAAAAAATEQGKNRHPYAECFHHECVSPGDAALVVALWLYRRERDAKLAVFTDAGLQLVDLPKDRRAITLEKLREKLTNLPLGQVKLKAPMEWASSTKTPVDVFMNLIDRPSRCLELEAENRFGRGHGGRYGPPPPPGKPDNCPVRALEKYRQQHNMPHSRLITMSLASHKVGSTDGTHSGVLDIVGIDEYVPKLIDAFAARHFD